MIQLVKKHKKHIIALAMSLLLIISVLPASVSAATNTSITSLPTAAGSTLYNGYIYTVRSNITINGVNYTNAWSKNALNVSSSATVVIDIAAGCTLTVTGGAGNWTISGGAGIYLPSNSTLIITGSGRLVARGGNSGASHYGYNGSSAYFSGDFAYTGYGGAGGSGGGGAGAGIGGYGGSGGNGGTGTGNRSLYAYSYSSDSNGWSGSSGGNGSAGTSMGYLYVLGNVVVDAVGGGSTSGASGGSAGSYSYVRHYISSTGYYYHTVSGGGGGGGGGFTYAAPAIGGGTGGAGGGGGGGEGASWTITTNWWSNAGGGGNGGYGGYNGSTGFRESTCGTRGGSGGYGGSMGGSGSNGTVYKAPTATIYGRSADGNAYYNPSAVYSIFYFDRQSGTGGSTSIGVNYGCPIGNISIPTRDMYTFMGYYSGINGSGTRYFDHRGVSTGAYYGTSNITLYAYWVQSQFNITLNKQGGSGGTSSVITTGTDGTLPGGISLPSKEHFAFGGYFQNAAGQGIQYYSNTGSVIGNKIKSNTSIYAYWTQNQYQITFNKQGGTGGSSTAWTTGTDGTLPNITLPTKSGFLFDGYYADENGTGTQYYNANGEAQNIKNTAANGITLYAKWISANFSITYELGGGTNNIENLETRNYGSETIIKAPTKQDYTFMGWQIDNGAQRYTTLTIPANNHDYAKNITLTATWLRSTITDAEIQVLGDGAVTNAEEIETALENVFDYIVTDNDKGITAADMAGDKSVKLVLTVTTSSDQDDKTQIIRAAQGTALIFYDLKVRKEVTEAGGSMVTTDLTELPIPITVKIAATGDLANKPAYAVYRIHGEETEKLPIDPKANGEYYDSVGNEIVIKTRKFSTYGIVGSETFVGNNNGSDTEFNGRQSIDVQGRILEPDPDKVYKLDIAWGDMKFEYSLQSEWDPETHMYTEGALNYWRSENHNGINNKVSVKNHSNGDVRVNFAASSELEGVAMSMHIYNEKTAELAQYFILGDAPVGSNDAELVPCDAYLFLDGIPTANWINQNKDAFTNVGVIVVTAEAYPEA